MADTTSHPPPATGPAPMSPALTPRSGLEFGPRPEATALGWNDLLPVTKAATEELINWLHSAVGKHQGKEEAAPPDGESPSGRDHVNEQLATSVLVAGDRGYGKTTVLLTLDYALRNPTKFLGLDTPEAAREPKRLEAMKTRLQGLQKSLLWLTPLDVEPLLAGSANLLATLLVRARDAIDRDHHRKERWAPPSLLEEGLNDPYGKIDKLIQDATFMWSDRRAQDALQGASQDVKAAEIYATFRKDFLSTMEGVSRLLSERRFGHGASKKMLLVLPIDNVDRSAQHLASIIKLMRMVASPRLWFVLAAGREEFQLFLERTFLRELTDFNQLPLDQRGGEETLAIARRQAAAAMRRVLPAAHQIKIRPTTPEDVWRFKVAPSLLQTEAKEPEELWTFLDQLPLPGDVAKGDGLKTLADLFDIEKRLRGPGNEGAALLKAYRDLRSKERSEARTPKTPAADGRVEVGAGEEAAGEEEGAAAPEQPAAGASALSVDVGGALFLDIQRQLRGVQGPVSEELVELVVRLQAHGGAPARRASRATPVLTYAGRLALNLSARGALDLWQTARLHVRQRDQHREEIPNHDGEPCVLCAELSIRLAVSMLRSAIDESELPDWASEQLHNRILRTDERNRIVLDLTGKPVRRKKVTTLSDVLTWSPQWDDRAAASRGEPSERPERLLRSELHLRHLKDDILELHDPEQPGRKVSLPPHVAGWYMVLHDLLVLSRERRVLNSDVTALDITPAMTVTLHTARLQGLGIARLGFWWIPPKWDTFVDFSIFTTQWRAFLHRVRDLFSPGDNAPVDRRRFAASRFVFVLAAWLDNIRSVARTERGGWNWEPLEEAWTNEGALADYLQYVAEALAELDEEVRDATSYGRAQLARGWLEQDVPLMLHPEFLPPFCVSYLGLREKLAAIPQWEERLAHQWPFIAGCRSALIHKTVGDSEDFQALEAEFGGDTRGRLALRRWRAKACESWEALTAPYTERVRGAS